eukprot:jgi/Chrzof1/14270/Cz08g31220.t1
MGECRVWLDNTGPAGTSTYLGYKSAATSDFAITNRLIGGAERDYILCSNVSNVYTVSCQAFNVSARYYYMSNVRLNTTHIPEAGANLYYSNTRTWAALSCGPGLAVANGYFTLSTQLNIGAFTANMNGLFVTNTGQQILDAAGNYKGTIRQGQILQDESVYINQLFEGVLSQASEIPAGYTSTYTNKLFQDDLLHNL